MSAKVGRVGMHLSAVRCKFPLLILLIEDIVYDFYKYTLKCDAEVR